MGLPCKGCGGTGWIGEDDAAPPCSVCNPEGNGSPRGLPGFVWRSVMLMDGDDGEVRDPDEPGQSAEEAGFPPAQVRAQAEKDLAQMMRERGRK